jgi:hypothetical protein
MQASEIEKLQKHLEDVARENQKLKQRRVTQNRPLPLQQQQEDSVIDGQMGSLSEGGIFQDDAAM